VRKNHRIGLWVQPGDLFFGRYRRALQATEQWAIAARRARWTGRAVRTTPVDTLPSGTPHVASASGNGSWAILVEVRAPRLFDIRPEEWSLVKRMIARNQTLPPFQEYPKNTAFYSEGSARTACAAHCILRDGDPASLLMLRRLCDDLGVHPPWPFACFRRSIDGRSGRRTLPSDLALDSRSDRFAGNRRMVPPRTETWRMPQVPEGGPACFRRAAHRIPRTVQPVAPASPTSCNPNSVTAAA